MYYPVNPGNPDSDRVDKAYKIIGGDFEFLIIWCKKFIKNNLRE
ncbi:hypothetical protein MTBBW1_640028 [Desulfamplus magnetovallimortis]|uniref:Uncharacterized protein n=1 Tax=Desulfamplus magnetovallimortis TaxID=1246637 RepID=A0A1W1HIP1_9BACT|nr:hypothetical protein MTBBW1_640028 [Desulfamplus magnetovallimortis]